MILYTVYNCDDQITGITTIVRGKLLMSRFAILTEASSVQGL